MFYVMVIEDFPISIDDSAGFSDNSVSFLLPGANGLVPLNPLILVDDAVATAFTDDYTLSGNPQLRIMENVESTLAYLSTASSVTECIERSQKVMFDTTLVTALHDTSSGVGAIIAGDYANQTDTKKYCAGE